MVGVVLLTLGLAALTTALADSRGRTLATIGLASYGAALLTARRLARWLGWTFVASGLLLAVTVIFVGDGPPEAIALPLLLGGIFALRQPRP